MSAGQALIPIPNSQIVGSVTDLLALHGSWKQSIRVTMPGHRGVTMALTVQCVLPVTLYEYEVVACVREATEQSGLKWWLRKTNRSLGDESQRQSQFTWGSLRFVCPHFRESYVKQTKDNSRDSKHRFCAKCKCCLSIKGIVVGCSLFLYHHCITN